MRIGIMCHSSCGGSVRIATELAAELSRRGHRMHLFSRTTPFTGSAMDGVTIHRTAVRKESLHPGVLYDNWSPREFEAYSDRIVKVIADEGLDLLHFHYAVPFAFVAQDIRNRLGQAAPLMLGTLHGTDVTVHGRDPVIGPRLSRVLRTLDGLTTVSLSHASLATKILRLPSFPTIIPNFVNLSRVRPRSGAQGSAQENPEGREARKAKKKARLIHISNFRPLKDPESVVRIFLGVRRKLDSELWLVGDGPEMRKIKSFLPLKTVEKDVRYLGLIGDPAPILADADLLVMSSVTESFCLTALEAMACGVPVLATKVGGLPEVVCNGKTGFLYPVGDRSSAVDFAVNLLSNPGMHKAMSEAAAMHARGFGHEQVVSSYEGFYESRLYKSAARSA